MTRDQAIALISQRITEVGHDYPDSLGMVLVASKSPGPLLGIRCERLGAAWGISVKHLPKVLDNLKQLDEDINVPMREYRAPIVFGHPRGQ